jgi:hypothetical protein
MDALAALFIFSISTTVLAVLGIASAAWGTDTRPTIGDDHAR